MCAEVHALPASDIANEHDAHASAPNLRGRWSKGSVNPHRPSNVIDATLSRRNGTDLVAPRVYALPPLVDGAGESFVLRRM